MIIHAILLLLAFLSLIGVRFIPRAGRLKHAWLLFCILNLAAAAVLSWRSFRKDDVIRKLQSELDAVEQASQPRSVTEDQAERLLEALRPNPPRDVIVVSRMMDGEGSDYADDLANVLLRIA